MGSLWSEAAPVPTGFLAMKIKARGCGAKLGAPANPLLTVPVPLTLKRQRVDSSLHPLHLSLLHSSLHQHPPPTCLMSHCFPLIHSSNFLLPSQIVLQVPKLQRQTHTHTHTHTLTHSCMPAMLSFSLPILTISSLTPSHFPTLSLSLSLSHTHTHTHTHKHSLWPDY